MFETSTITLVLRNDSIADLHCQPHEVTRLELRIGEHRPAYVTAKDAEKIFEPLPVEGYVYRMRLVTNTRNLLYLSVHSGCLFFLPSASADPPTPPIPAMSNDAVSSSSKGTRVSLEDSEKRRGMIYFIYLVIVIIIIEFNIFCRS